jgi:hypothetical protein
LSRTDDEPEIDQDGDKDNEIAEDNVEIDEDEDDQREKLALEEYINSISLILQSFP